MDALSQREAGSATWMDRGPPPGGPLRCPARPALRLMLALVLAPCWVAAPAWAQIIEDEPTPPPPPPRQVPAPPPVAPRLPAVAPPQAAPPPPPVSPPPALPRPPPPRSRPSLDEEDDPKPSAFRAGAPRPRSAEAPTQVPVAAAVAKSATPAEPERPEHPTPFIKVGYRYFQIANLDKTRLALHGFQLDMYPVSRRWFRVGVELEVGGGSSTLDGRPSGTWYGFSGASIGFQYPWRVTPFVEGRFAAGLIGVQYYDSIDASHGAFTWGYLGGIDVGAEVYLSGKAYISAALGWVRTTYQGVDYVYVLSHPRNDPVYLDLAADAFTFKVSVGL